MSIGDVTLYTAGDAKSIVLLATTAAANLPPSSELDGLSVNDIMSLFGRMPVEVGLLLYSTAGSGTMTCTARLWSYHPGAAMWFPLGTGADATKGVINATVAIGETGTDTIRHQETIALVGLIGSRIYLEITAIGGTATAVTAELVVRRAYPQ